MEADLWQRLFGMLAVVATLGAFEFAAESFGVEVATVWPREHVSCRIQVLEESWVQIGPERVAKYYQSCQKLARVYGIANISVARRISDLRAQSDDGTSVAKVSMGILADTQTCILPRSAPYVLAAEPDPPVRWVSDEPLRLFLLGWSAVTGDRTEVV